MKRKLKKHLNPPLTFRNENVHVNGGLILDVREEAEYAFGHIDGAKSIPMGELDARLNELDKESRNLCDLSYRQTSVI